jgi:hypothetical protein
VALTLALIFSIVSYRRYYMRIPESSDARQSPGRRWSLVGISSLVDRVFLKSPFQRACYYFSLRALLRSETHSILFGAFVGLGLVVASQIAVDAPVAPGTLPDRFPSVDMLATSLAVAYCVVIGLRFVFELPAGINANWMYKLILGDAERETGATAKKIALTFLAPGIVVPCFFAYSWEWGWRIGLAHALYLLAISILLMDVVFFRFRKIPFACTLPAFQNHAIMLVFVYVLGFFLFTDAGAALERHMLEYPLLFIALPVLFGLCYDVLRRMKKDTPEIDLRLRYEAETAKEVQTLNIG